MEQVETRVNSAWFRHLKLKHDTLLSSFASSCNLRLYTEAPLVPRGTPVVNALPKQRAMLENIFRACIGLAPDNNMMLEYK